MSLHEMFRYYLLVFRFQWVVEFHFPWVVLARAFSGPHIALKQCRHGRVFLASTFIHEPRFRGGGIKRWFPRLWGLQPQPSRRWLISLTSCGCFVPSRSQRRSFKLVFSKLFSPMGHSHVQYPGTQPTRSTIPMNDYREVVGWLSMLGC